MAQELMKIISLADENRDQKLNSNELKHIIESRSWCERCTCFRPNSWKHENQHRYVNPIRRSGCSCWAFSHSFLSSRWYDIWPEIFTISDIFPISFCSVFLSGWVSVSYSTITCPNFIPGAFLRRASFFCFSWCCLFFWTLPWYPGSHTGWGVWAEKYFLQHRQRQRASMISAWLSGFSSVWSLYFHWCLKERRNTSRRSPR